MNRRQFLKLAGALLVADPILSLPASSKEPPVVAVAEGQDYGVITKNAINAIGGIGQFVKRGQTVVVKPNMGWDRKPELAATTHPTVVKGIVRSVCGWAQRR